MDLIGPFVVTNRGNQFALTTVCMLTNYVIRIPLSDKAADTVIGSYLRKEHCQLLENRKNLI